MVKYIIQCDIILLNLFVFSSPWSKTGVKQGRSQEGWGSGIFSPSPFPRPSRGQNFERKWGFYTILGWKNWIFLRRKLLQKFFLDWARRKRGHFFNLPPTNALKCTILSFLFMTSSQLPLKVVFKLNINKYGNNLVQIQLQTMKLNENNGRFKEKLWS